MSFFQLIHWGPTGWLDELTFACGFTLVIALVSFAFGTVFGALAATAKIAGGPIARGVADAYTTIIRGVPDLLIIYLFYFGGSALLTSAGGLLGADGRIELPRFLTATLAIGLASGAYQAEVMRGAFLAIHPGQLEAARACGFRRWTLFRRIIAPQVLRFAVPGLGNVWQLCLKESALVAVVGLTLSFAGISFAGWTFLDPVIFADLLRQAVVGAGSTRQPFTFYITAAGFYLLLTTLSTYAFNGAERWALRGLRRG
jgi:octopine/nopaline transport system permease protein